MKITWKTLLALFFCTLGAVGWFYVGGWMILRGPVRGVIHQRIWQEICL